MLKMEKLKVFESEFEAIKANSDLTKSRKGMLLATLMTKLESEYNIPLLSDTKWNEQNKEIFTLYREISSARK